MNRLICLRRKLFAVPLCALLTVAILLPGCVPYTTGFKSDPRTRQTSIGLDQSAAQAGPTRLAVIAAPSAKVPATPLTFRVSHTLTGPEANKTTFQENTYKSSWAPLIIPLGALLTALTPLVISVAALSDDDKKFESILGVDDPNPCKHGVFKFSIMALVGIVDSCDIVESRTNQELEPTGKTISEEVGIAGVALEVRLTTASEAPIVRTLTTDPNGHATLDAAPLFRAFRAQPSAVEIVVHASGAGNELVQTARLEPETTSRLFLPLEEERLGDRALAEGKGLVALDHFTLAHEQTLIPADADALQKKVFDCYRTLLIKPPVPEETRRLIVQAEAMANENDSERAIALLKEAIHKTSWLPTPRYNLAMAHAMNRDYTPAIESMNAYLELAPEADDARKARDLVYQWEAARDKAGAESPKPAAATQSGRGR